MPVVFIAGDPAVGFYGSNSVSGTVTNDAGVGAVRDVQVHDRASGLLIGSTTSASDGSYTVSNLIDNAVVDVTFLDDAAGTQYNDLIVSRVTV